jgi:integrase
MASVTRRRTKTGATRYDVRYWTPDGSQRSETFRTRKDADRWASSVETDQHRGAWIDPRAANRLFSDVSALWLMANPTKRPSAYARDESIIRVHLVPAFGDLPVGKVTPPRVRAVVESWSELQPRTVRRMYGVLRAIFAYAVEEGLFLASPCRGVKLPSVDPVSCHVVTAGELVQLAEALGEDYAAMVYLGAMLGLRWGEVAGLRVQRLDLLARTLTVAEQATRGPKGTTVFGPPKSNAGRRILAIPESLAEMLAMHLARRGLTAADAAALVFTAADGDVLDYANFRHRIWLPACERSRLSGLKFHDLRRANATALVQAGVDIKTAQARLGHSDPRLTLGVYAQATSEADRAAATMLDASFSPPVCDGRAMGSF